MERKRQKMKRTMDGNEAAAYASYAFTEAAAIYPITPSSPMAEYVDKWASQGKENIFGKPVSIVEMQSEAGAISAVHGLMEAGVLTSTYTSSQGLLLMIPTMYRIAGHLKPGVIHVASRSVALHAYSINAEHSDVMSCRATGYGMLASSNVQEAMDLGAVAHLASIKSSIPFMHFFDGFRTSHEIQKIDCLDYDDLKALIDYQALEHFRRDALNPDHPLVRNTGQAPETFFQSREACQVYYEHLPETVETVMNQINRLTGRDYRLFNYHGAQDAEIVVAAIGSVAGACREVVDYLMLQGKKVGFLEIHLYRPFSISHFVKALPESTKTIVALDRTKENGALGDPLFEDICGAVNDSGRSIQVIAGRYGIGGKDTTPAQILAVFENAASENPINHFTVGITDDVHYRSLPVGSYLDTSKADTICCKIWGLGSDGTVGANKNSIKIIGDNTDLFVQAYFEYEGKKSGGLTKSHLRFGKSPICASYYVNAADFVACHQQTYVKKYDVYSSIKPNGAFLLNCSWSDAELSQQLPGAMKRYLANNNIRVYTIDASAIAKNIGLGSRTNTVLQAAFFKITGIIPVNLAVEQMKAFAEKTYGLKGADVVAKNFAAVDCGIQQIHEVVIPESWKDCPDETMKDTSYLPEGYPKKILLPVSRQNGESLKVSDFLDMADGRMPSGTSKYERRGIAAEVPCWNPDLCLQCNLCAYICPNSAIRPFLLKIDELENAPRGMKRVPAKGKGLSEYTFVLQVDPLDCIGCGACANTCPAKEKALTMKPLNSQREEMENWEYVVSLPERNPVGSDTVKNSQFNKPLLEFPGCCPGCGEPAYVKVATQLFGDRMCIATATGCALVWSTDYPVTPYTANEKGRGPAMSNSLFENNGEFGFGMAMGYSVMRKYAKDRVSAILDKSTDMALKAASEAWLDGFSDGDTSVRTTENLVACLKRTTDTSVKEHVEHLLRNQDHLTKKSIWIVGGDGWAYDIGYGGLDHVLAMGLDVNVLVLDTEVYSNTGGQASKATQKGAVAQFAAAGRQQSKKNLGMMVMSYENVYVASVAMGANQTQYLKALKEAESYNGPSIIIAYAPCQSHGLRCGMGGSMQEMKRAVDAGYWTLYRYDPRRREEGKNPFVLDSGEPDGSFRSFLDGEVRFSALKKLFPEDAERLASQAAQEAMSRYRKYRAMAEETVG